MELRHRERRVVIRSVFALEAITRVFRTKFRPKVTLRGCKTSASNEISSKVSKTSVSYEISSKSHTLGLQNERFVRDSFFFFFSKTIKVSKTSISCEISSKNQLEAPIGAHTSHSPAKQFRDCNPSKYLPLTRQSQCHSDIHLHHNSQPHDSLRLPRIFPRPHV